MEMFEVLWAVRPWSISTPCSVCVDILSRSHIRENLLGFTLLYTPRFTTPQTDSELCGDPVYRLVCGSPNWKLWNNYTNKNMTYDDSNEMNSYYSFLGQMLVRSKHLSSWGILQSTLDQLKNSTYVFPRCKSQDLFQRMIQVRKSAFVNWNTELDDFLRALRMNGTDKLFYKGQDLLFPRARNWLVDNFPNRLPRFRLR